MQPNWLRAILDAIDFNIKHVPKGRIQLENIDSMNIEQLLSALNRLFIIEEAAIEEENSKSFVTDNYETGVRHFAERLVISMAPSHGKLKEYKDYLSLLGQRHVAYGFYSALVNERNSKYFTSIRKDPAFEKPLYLGLVEYYRKFYGRFSDNEEAIKLLCEFYPKEIDVSKHANNIADALFQHITSAGTPGDIGFAYNGIELIRRHIGNLPTDIINKVLQKYEVYKIVNEKIYRHQIFTIIDKSIMADEEKQKYKFSYLDSLLLANYMNDLLYKKYEQHGSNLVTRNYISHTTNLSVDKINLLKYLKTDNIYAYWTNSCSTKRSFIVDEKAVINLSLNSGRSQIYIKYTDRPTNGIDFEFKYEDWMLEDYRTKKTEQKLLNFVFEVSNGEAEIIYNSLTFSLLYLSNYRGINEQLVDFDHRFIYDEATNELSTSTVSSVIPHFYGKKVHSLSCIVGKNGTGKTSTVDFLRGTFFRLLRLIEINEVPCKNGYVNEVDYEAHGILDKGCEFFVVFHLGIEPYYLTNIETVTVTIAKPFDISAYKSVNELSKVVYFSNKLSVSQDDLYTDEGMITRNESTSKKIAKTLINFRQADYSEAASFIQKRKEIEVAKQKDNSAMVVNKDLCYQLAFLGYLTQEKMVDYFDMPIEKVFTLKSDSLKNEEISLMAEHSLKEIIDENTLALKSILRAPDAKLGYFSSGQYAKFSFLAKLYWFLEGYHKNRKDFESVIGTDVNIFSRDDALNEEETALIFIDEGELYYHPEWQRSYIKTLIDNIHDAKTEATLQVVVTTNSPFIISDILSEDITYLTNEEKDFGRTFGQNIHKLLKGNFFMSYTIGAYSQEVIENIMGWLMANKKNKINVDEENKINIGEELSRYFGEPIEPKDYYGKISCLIDKIGEPIYREKLLDTLRESELGKTSEMEILLRQKAEIERKLEVLQEGQVKS